MDEELICPICQGVLEEPVAVPECEHAFCRKCIAVWLANNSSCPVDRGTVRLHQLKIAPRITRNMIQRYALYIGELSTNIPLMFILFPRLEVVCANDGCGSMAKFDIAMAHEKICQYNPQRPQCCELGCGFIVPRDKIKEHSCVLDLRREVKTRSA